MLSKSIFTSSNILIHPLKSSYLVSNKNIRKTYHKTIAISHGSGGLSETEIKLSDFFLEKGFEVQLFDHFATLGVDNLYWGYDDGFMDQYKVSLLRLIETVSIDECMSQNHLGMSLGAYIGMNTADVYKNIFCCYPGILPILKNQYIRNAHKFHFFEGALDSWTNVPEILKDFIGNDRIHYIESAYHSFMSQKKDKETRVYKYQFKDLLVEKEILSNIELNHFSISKVASWERIVSKNKTSQNAIEYVLNKILQEVNHEK